MLKVFNTLSGKKEEFKPIKDNQVGIYLCGPTVYDFGHLGHARSAVSFDIIRRHLEYKGYKVTFVSNYTDVDDKMIKRANEEGISVKELSEKIIPEYVKDYLLLKIKKPDKQPRATEHIPTIIKITESLLKKGFAYKNPDGIYFDVTRFKDYGKLSKQDLEALKMGARVDVDPNKKNPQDFALWKNAKEGEPSWKAPFGEGRPGWHIECSAMIYDLLGAQIDIHAGGYDLTFPHHECEIAQSESFTGKKPYVKYWMHNGFVKIDNEKMSKSLGNFFTIKEILEKYPAIGVRYFLIQTHYRSPINFSHEGLDQAKESQKRVQDFYLNLNNYQSDSNKETKIVSEAVSETYKKFEEAMDNDFEVAKALAAIFELIKKINPMTNDKTLSEKDKENILEILLNLNSVLEIIETKEEKLPVEISELIQKREEARKNKDWKSSDELRDELKEKGILVEDTKDGTIWKKI